MRPSKMPASRRITHLGNALRATVDPFDAACIRIERAGLMARRGQTEDAKAELAAMREWLLHHPHDRVAVWLAIAEGWLAHYTNMSRSAADRMRRALALATQARLPRLQALSAAWLAHFSFFRDDIDGMAQYLAQSATLVEPLDHSTMARLSLVVATAYHFADRLDLATPWYTLARHHAVACGDEAMLSGLAFNLAANHTTHALTASVFGDAPPVPAHRTMATVEAVGNFDEWIGMVSLDALVPILRAMNASVAGQFRVAIDLYDVHLLEAEQQGVGHMQSVFLADMAWCRVQLGDPVGAEADADAALRRLDAMQVEDLAAAHGRLSQVFAALGQDEAAARHRASADAFRADQQKLHARIVDVLTMPALGCLLEPSSLGAKAPA